VASNLPLRHLKCVKVAVQCSTAVHNINTPQYACVQARPKKKIDWRAWSEAQLDLPPANIAIPHPPPSRRTQLVPPLGDMSAELSDVQPSDQSEDDGLKLNEQQGSQQAEQQHDTVRTAEQHT
jgi:hypothetical protein